MTVKAEVSRLSGSATTSRWSGVRLGVVTRSVQVVEPLRADDQAVVASDTGLTLRKFAWQPVLRALTLATPTVLEHTLPGVVVSAIGGLSEGVALALVDDAGGVFALDEAGTALVTGLVETDHATAAGHFITFRQTVGNSHLDTTLFVSVVETVLLLSALQLSNTLVSRAAGVGSVIGTISGNTDGSTVHLSNNNGGRFSLSGLDVVVAKSLADETETTAYPIIATEALEAAANSPFDTNFAIEVVESGGVGVMVRASISFSGDVQAGVFDRIGFIGVIEGDRNVGADIGMTGHVQAAVDEVIGVIA